MLVDLRNVDFIIDIYELFPQVVFMIGQNRDYFEYSGSSFLDKINSKKNTNFS